ncbi:MAG: glycosyltransferase family 4 protein [Prochlorotrichaceae cyanobacterium]
MKILIYSYNYHPEPIGIAPLLTELAEGLVGRGHQVRVITAMPNYPQRVIYPEYKGKVYVQETRNGVEIQRCYVRVRPQPGLLDRILLDASFVLTSLGAAFQGWKPDIILYTSPPLPAAVVVALLSLWYRCPTVLSLQDILPEAAIHVGLVRNPLAIYVFEALEKFSYGLATRIAVITEKFTENLLKKGVSPDKMTCIPNWVNVDFVKPLPKLDNPFRHQQNLGDRFVVMYSGNIALTQGLKTVIRAAKLLEAESDIVFVIVGEEKAIAELEDICDQLAVTNVKLLPFQPRETVPEMLAAADVGLIVQRQTVIAFNMPSKTQLLLASGRPIIASVPLEGSAAQVVNQSQGGLVVSPENPKDLADAVLKLYHDRDYGERLGAQGRDYAVQYYRFERSLAAYESLFLELSEQ